MPENQPDWQGWVNFYYWGGPRPTTPDPFGGNPGSQNPTGYQNPDSLWNNPYWFTGGGPNSPNGNYGPGVVDSGIPNAGWPMWGVPNPGGIYGSYIGPSSVGAADYSGMGPAGWMSGQWANMGGIPDAANPMYQVNLANEIGQWDMAQNFASAANRFGQLGMLPSSSYMRELGDVAGQTSRQMGQDYTRAMYTAAQDAANRQMQAAQGLAGQAGYYQQAAWDPINQLNQLGVQEYGMGQNAMQLQYQDWLRQMYGNRDFALNLLGNPGAQTGAIGQPHQQGGTDWGSIIGGIASIAGLFMSDARAKENVKTVGHVGDLRIVEFNYKGSSIKRIGVIAQEIEREHPFAVQTINGFKHVNYAALPLRRF